MTFPVTVPSRSGETPFLELHLSMAETVNIIERHLNRIAASGHLQVQFRSTRDGETRGLVTTITAWPAEAGD